MNTYQVKMFGGLKKFFAAELQISLPVNASVLMLTDALMEINPEAAELLGIAMIAMNEKMIQRTALLEPNSSIAILPPFSGG